jgi:hypothetical protein
MPYGISHLLCPSHRATSLLYSSIIELEQVCVLVPFLLSSTDRVLMCRLTSNIWRASTRLPFSKPVDHLRTRAFARDRDTYPLTPWCSPVSYPWRFPSVPCAAALANRRSLPRPCVSVPRHLSIRIPPVHSSLSHLSSSTPSPWNTRGEALLQLLPRPTADGEDRAELVGLHVAVDEGHEAASHSCPSLY